MELAENRRFTTLDGDQAILSEWGDGGHYPSNYSSQPGCITHPNREFTLVFDSVSWISKGIFG